MLHTGTSEGLRAAGRDPAGGTSRVLFAVASPPRLADPARWGWPHWLAPPAFKAGGHRSSHRHLEHYR
jgi:hypothetical protein